MADEQGIAGNGPDELAAAKVRIAELVAQVETLNAEHQERERQSAVAAAAALAAKQVAFDAMVRENARLHSRIGQLEVQVAHQYGDLQVVQDYNQRAAEAIFDQQEALVDYDMALGVEHDARLRTAAAGRRWRAVARRLASALPPARVRSLLAR